MDKLKNATNFLKNKLKKDQLEQKLNEAVSEENWQASTQLLHQIANASYNFENQQKIIQFVWNKLKHKSWKKVLKTLHLIDFLLKYGPTPVIDNFKENVYEFRKLDDYTAQSGGTDQGQSVRKQAKAIVVLVTDDQLLNDERAKAKQIKDRMANVIGSGAYFGGFNNDMKNNSSNTKGSSYSSISSESYKYGPSSSGGGMSFGESVMKQLHEKKKYQVQPEPQKAPQKLNLNNMMEKGQQKKPETEKKSFNSLSMKLVKPPEKKPVVGPPAKAKEPSKPADKPPQKSGGNVDILDMNFDDMSSTQPTKVVEVKNNTVNLMQDQPAQTQILNPTSYSESPQLNQNFNFQQAQIPPPSSIHSMPVQVPSTLNYQQNYSQPANLNMLGVQPKHIDEPVVLKLQQKKVKQEKKDEGSLIDFSNFRQELGSIKQEDKKEPIASNWNW